jgi:hypothetical protein
MSNKLLISAAVLAAAIAATACDKTPTAETNPSGSAKSEADDLGKRPRTEARRESSQIAGQTATSGETRQQSKRQVATGGQTEPQSEPSQAASSGETEQQSKRSQAASGGKTEEQGKSSQAESGEEIEAQSEPSKALSVEETEQQSKPSQAASGETGPQSKPGQAVHGENSEQQSKPSQTASGGETEQQSKPSQPASGETEQHGKSSQVSSVETEQQGNPSRAASGEKEQQSKPRGQGPKDGKTNGPSQSRQKNQTTARRDGGAPERSAAQPAAGVAVSQNDNAPLSASDARMQAPIGHRQPRPSDFPPDVQRDEQLNPPSAQAQPAETQPAQTLPQNQRSNRGTRAANVPTIDVQKGCQEAENVLASIFGPNNIATVGNCLKQEQEARQTIINSWTKYPATDKQKCIITTAYLPSYVEWLTCLEMYRDVKNIESMPSDQVQTSGRGSPRMGGHR